MFRAGGHIDSEGFVETDGLHCLMQNLATRIGAEDPTDDRPDNPDIPSGYTYLLQFIAHDMADSVVSLSIDGDSLCPGFRNARSAPLLLDTLYGSGPDEYPQAYEFRSTDANIPRSYLRLGPPSAIPPPAGYCPFRDIARSAPNSNDQGQPALQPADPCAPVERWLTEAMLADPRNDAHALISQLTVLFQLLHNHILGEIEKATPHEPASSQERRELAYRRFRCARLIVTLVYRNILKTDVLDKILDKNIYADYVTYGRAPRDSAEGIPLEFTFGAFRFGHAMVRPSYMTNTEHDRTTDFALQLSSQQLPGKLPVTADWFVDWARFFSTTPDRPGEPHVQRNFSKVIGPHYAGFLERGKNIPGGLALRDLLSASYAGLLSVAALSARMRCEGFPVDEYDKWREPLRAWLLQKDSPFGPDGADPQRVIDDPPLPFFVLFEASHANGGRRLGPIGSIVVAETVLGAMRRNPLGIEERGAPQKNPIVNCGRLFFGKDDGDRVSSSLSGVARVATMPQLLGYMRGKGWIG
jgi:hypothetical protein